MDVDRLKKIFREYVEKYDINDEGIIRKLEHSYRVMDICISFAKYYKFDEETTEIATLIGLLHDYARFEQWTKFHTYNDLNSFDHGDVAVDKLFGDREIVNYCDKELYYDKIYNTIKYHNKYGYPDTLDEKNKLFCKIIRDADKLDIFYLLGTEKILLKEDDGEISDKVKKDFFANKLISRVDVKNGSDVVILDLAMVFDLNFDYSYKYLYDMKLIDKIFDNIKDKSKFEMYFNYINDYIGSKIK